MLLHIPLDSRAPHSPRPPYTQCFGSASPASRQTPPLFPCLINARHAKATTSCLFNADGCQMQQPNWTQNLTKQLLQLVQQLCVLAGRSPAAECAGAHKALACWPEAAAWCGHDVALLQDLSEHVPAGLAREAHPHVWRIFATCTQHTMFRVADFSHLRTQACALTAAQNSRTWFPTCMMRC